jgi:hypothetical protein
VSVGGSRRLGLCLHESVRDNQYNERKGEELKRDDSHQVRQLPRAGLLQQRTLESVGLKVLILSSLFIIGQDQCNGGEDDSETGRLDEDEGDQEDVPVCAAAP